MERADTVVKGGLGQGTLEDPVFAPAPEPLQVFMATGTAAGRNGFAEMVWLG